MDSLHQNISGAVHLRRPRFYQFLSLQILDRFEQGGLRICLKFGPPPIRRRLKWIALSIVLQKNALKLFLRYFVKKVDFTSTFKYDNFFSKRRSTFSLNCFSKNFRENFKLIFLHKLPTKGNKKLAKQISDQLNLKLVKNFLFPC